MQYRKTGGFTLIELMIVVVIVGILAAVAYPSYVQYGIRSRRAAATADLMELAQVLEREFTATGRYDDGANPGALRNALPFNQSPREDTRPGYNLAVPALNSVGFTVSATPIVPPQSDPQCGILTLTNTATKCINNGASCSNVPAQQAAVDVCW